jgi:hypothetical protein
VSELVSARVLPLERLFHLGRFRPAAVQRDYQWDEGRAETLLREITAAMHAARGFGFLASDETLQERDADLPEPAEGDIVGLPVEISEFGAQPADAVSMFYLGTMVFCPGNASEFEIFDGLQRLTTLTILIAVLRDLVKDSAAKERLQSAIMAGPEQYRLVHAGNDTTLSRMIQPPGQAGILRQKRTRPATNAGKRIFDVNRRFVKVLQRRDQGELAALTTFLLDYVLAGIVETKDQKLARHIFVATNLYGLPLRRDEVFKGQLLSLAMGGEEARQIEDTWNTLREKVSASSFEAFLTAFDAIERRQLQGADCLGNLIDHLGKRTAAGELTMCLNALDKHADAWRELENYLRNPDAGPVASQIWRLGFFKWNEWRPLALHWIERHRAFPDDEKLWNKTASRLAELGRRCMAITLYDFGEDNRADMFLKALQGALRRQPLEPFGKSPHSGPLDFSQKVRSTIRAGLVLPVEDYEIRRSLMLWFEASLWEGDEKKPAHIMGASVEHVLPDKPSLASQWLVNFPDEEERYLRHGSIGNLGLVDGPVNAELGNKDFGIKKALLHERRQFAKYKCIADVEHCAEWTPARIQERTLAMASMIWNRLDLPEPAQLLERADA